MILLLCTVLLTPVEAEATSDPVDFHFLPGLHARAFSRPGDVSIGVIAPVAPRSSLRPAEACSEEIKRSSYTLEVTEAVAFAVDAVNRDPDLLPNVTLGFTVRGSCNSMGATLGASMAFLPRSTRLYQDNGNGSTCLTRPSTSDDPRWSSHDVVGVLAPTRSGLAVPVSSLYAVAALPLLGYVVTSDELSVKADHPYFFRLVPPDAYQVRAILEFVGDNGWSYVSVVYRDGPYGQKAFDQLDGLAAAYGVCVAGGYRLTASTDPDDVMRQLLLTPRARVVVLFVVSSDFRNILQAAVDRNATRHFVWLGADGVTTYTGHQYRGTDLDPAVGTFTFDLYTTYVSAFYDHVRTLRPWSSDNPWLAEVWEALLGCSLQEGTCREDEDLLQSQSYRTYKGTALRIDAVLTFAHAIHLLLSEECPGVGGAAARACITGELLRLYMRKVSFNGYCGRVQFDANQDVKGKYVIGQLVYDYYDYPFRSGRNAGHGKQIWTRRIGVYDISTNAITYFNQSVSWAHLAEAERVVPWSKGKPTTDVPESVCSGPCQAGEYKIEKELACCWDCRKCRENERLVDGNTSCQACPSLTWPDQDSAFTACTSIPPIYPHLGQALPVILAASATLALFMAALVLVCYVFHRRERVIKASGKELSGLQLAAIFIGYATVVFLQAMPTDLTCIVSFYMFCTSFALLYCPLLVKTIRIVRIFRSGKTSNKNLAFISPESQLVFAGSLIVVQVALCGATHWLYHPKALLSQPVWSEKLVELSCDFTLPGLGSFLAYNLVLVALCSAFAFQVRSVPDNFNESRFISLCVSATLLIWLAFIPAYFTAARQFVRAFLLSMTLVLNHSVALTLLFVPKIYAVVFLAREDVGHVTAGR